MKIAFMGYVNPIVRLSIFFVYLSVWGFCELQLGRFQWDLF